TAGEGGYPCAWPRTVCRVGGQRGTAGAALFQPPPSEPDLHTFEASGSPVNHSDSWSIIAACVDVVMASLADNQRFPPSCRHDLRPARLRSSPRLVDVRQLADVVDLDGSWLTAKLACFSQQALNDFRAVVAGGEPCLLEVEVARAHPFGNPLKRPTAERSYQWFLVRSIDDDLKHLVVKDTHLVLLVNVGHLAPEFAR